MYAITLLLFVLFEVGSGLAKNIQTRVILRFFAGFFGSTPLSNAGGSIADVVNARQRTFVFPVFANAGFLGPILGPVIGGYLGMNVGQAWCDYLTAIWGAATLAVVVCFMPETYGPVLLRMKAAQVRKATGDNRYKSALEMEREKVPFKAHFKHVIALPFLYLICACMPSWCACPPPVHSFARRRAHCCTHCSVHDCDCECARLECRDGAECRESADIFDGSTCA